MEKNVCTLTNALKGMPGPVSIMYLMFCAVLLWPTLTFLFFFFGSHPYITFSGIAPVNAGTLFTKISLVRIEVGTKSRSFAETSRY